MWSYLYIRRVNCTYGKLTVDKESVVVEEIKEVEQRSRRAQFIYVRNYNRIGLQPRAHTPSRHSQGRI